MEQTGVEVLQTTILYDLFGSNKQILNRIVSSHSECEMQCGLCQEVSHWRLPEAANLHVLR